MKETRLTMPELALIAGTRAALGAGVALLLGDLLPKEKRNAVGWTLFLVGAVTTVPLLIEVLGKRVEEREVAPPSQLAGDNRSERKNF